MPRFHISQWWFSALLGAVVMPSAALAEGGHALPSKHVMPRKPIPGNEAASQYLKRKPLPGNAAIQQAALQPRRMAPRPMPMREPEPPPREETQRERQERITWQQSQQQESEIDLALAGGWRQDDFFWNIAGDTNGQNPNILSELSWEEVTYATLEGQGSYHYRPGTGMLGYYAEAAGFYGSAFSGDNQDSDYFGDNRTLEFSRSNNAAEEGHVAGITGAVGGTLNFTTESSRYRVLALGGLGYRQQELTLTKGYQTIPASGAFLGLNSSYETTWWGPFVGLESSAQFMRGRHAVRVRGEYHMVDYEGIGNWNLRADFAHPESFIHTSDGKGVILLMEYRYALRPKWTLGLKARLEQWDVDAGVDQTNFANGTVAYTRFNEAEWTSQSYLVQLGVQF